MISDGQITAINILLGRWTKKKKCLLFVVHKLAKLQTPLKLLADLTEDEWRDIRDQAYPDWKKNDWKTIDDEFIHQVRDLVQRYNETVLGQLRMFE